jgi:ring-1,2-phenylacetyl-CoA epoxidase subunit PaaD
VVTTAVLDDVKRELARVKDPEIPAISIVDLGIVHDVRIDDERIAIELLPTFVGCPALDAIRLAVEERLSPFGRSVDVSFTFAEPWTTDRITPDGRDALRRSGFAPPTPGTTWSSPLVVLGAPTPCPYCGSLRTVLENAFGPTQCRTIRYCTTCRQPFEHFKEL